MNKPKISSKMVVNPKLLCQYLIILVLFLACVANTYAIELKKEIKKIYDPEIIQKIGIVNESGEIQLETWKKNSIALSITVTVTTTNSTMARKEIENYSAEFDTINNEILILTKLPKISISLWKRIFGPSNQVKYDFSYKIKCPSNIVFDIKNAHGDIKIDFLKNPSRFDIFKGNIKAEKLNSHHEFRLDNAALEVGTIDSMSIFASYSSIKLGKLKAGRIQLKYSQLSAEKLTRTNIESLSGVIDIAECYSSVFLSSFDKLSIGKTHEISINTKRSEVKLGTVGNIKITGEHTKIKIHEIIDQKSLLEIIGKYYHTQISASSPYVFTLETKNLQPDIKNPAIILSNRNYKQTTWSKDAGYLKVEHSKNRIYVKQEYGSLILE